MVGSRSVRSLTMVVAALAVAGLAGCADTRGNLETAAGNLEYNANTLARDAGAEVAPADEAPPRGEEAPAYASEFARDAHVLARDAHEFRVVVNEGGTDRAIHEAFDRVSRSYHAVRDEVAHSDSREAHRDLAGISDSYRALQHELGIYPGNDEYLPPA